MAAAAAAAAAATAAAATNFVKQGRKIVAIGRNYRCARGVRAVPPAARRAHRCHGPLGRGGARPQRSDHATELGNAVPAAPFFFLKPTSSYICQGQAIEVPAGAVVHHEGVRPPARHSAMCRSPGPAC